MNGSTTSRTEIVDFLKSKGMDMNNNRFLILQGEVEQISLMKPITGKRDEPGLLEYLEDIIGSHIYVDKIQELEESFGEMKRIKENQMLLMHDMKKDVDSMEEHKVRAVKYLEAEKKIMSLSHILLLFRIYEIQEKEKAKEARLESLMEEAEKGRKEMDAGLVEYRTDFKTMKGLVAEKEEKKGLLTGLEKVQERQKQEDQQKDSRIKLLIENGHERKKNIEKSQAAIGLLKEENGKKQEQIPVLEKEVGELRSRIEENEKLEREILAKIEPKIEATKKKIIQLDEKMAPFDRSIKNIEASKKSFVKELEELNERENKTVENLEKVEVDIRSSMTTMERIGQKMEEGRQALNQINTSANVFEETLKELMQEDEPIRRELRQIEDRLQERKVNNEEQIQKNAVLTYLEKSTEVRALGKIYGRIGDLGSIDKKYDIAISATGMQYHNILVESSDIVTGCLKLLKRDRVGSASFQCLNKIRYLVDKMNKPFTAPANSQRLFDLVNCPDENVKLAFYQILEDTLVCRDLDTSQKVAYGNVDGRRYRVVTEDGFLINLNGTMAGGGRPKQGLVSFKLKTAKMDVEENFEGLITKKENLINQQNKIQKDLLEVKSKILGFQKDRTNIPLQIAKLGEELKSEEQNKLMLQERKTKFQEELKGTSFKTKKAELLKENEKLEKELKKIEVESSKLMQERKRLEDEILEIGGGDFKKICEELTHFRSNVQSKEQTLERSKADLKRNETVVIEKTKENEESQKLIKSYEEEVQKIKKEKLELEEEFLKVIGEINDYKEQIEKVEKKFEDMSEKIKKAMQVAEGHKKRLDELNKLIEGLKEERNQHKQERINLVEDLKINKEKYLKFVVSYSFLNELTELEKDVQGEASDSKDDSEETVPRQGSKRGLGNLTINEITPDKEISREELESYGFHQDQVKQELVWYKNEKMESKADTEMIQLYIEKLKLYKQKYGEYNSLHEKEMDLKKNLIGLKNKRKMEFMTGFTFISKTLKQVYQAITNGGDADLELIDSYDPFTEGIMFSVRPPHKSWKHMSKLSGGEKTLSSLSLIFALHYYKPTPIYFMDEIDAALDFRNVEIVGKFIKERTKNAQFIVISLRNHMYELSNQLVGIYKTNDTTKTIWMYPSQVHWETDEAEEKEVETKRMSSLMRRSKKSVKLVEEESALKVINRKSQAMSKLLGKAGREEQPSL
jgi:structural maintenance of chromosome 4